MNCDDQPNIGELCSLSFLLSRWPLGNKSVDVHWRRGVHHDQLLRRQGRRPHLRHLPGRYPPSGTGPGDDYLLHLRHPRTVALHSQHASSHQHKYDTVSKHSTAHSHVPISEVHLTYLRTYTGRRMTNCASSFKGKGSRFRPTAIGWGAILIIGLFSTLKENV